MKFSVIMPVYNSEHYLKRALSSVLNQTYVNWELLVIDDGSTDNSFVILSDFQKKDNRIKVFQQKNAGPGIARNVGIRNATGDYLVFIDSDDYISNDYFELLSKHAKNNDIVFIDVIQTDENGCQRKTEKMSTYQKCDKDVLLTRMMTGSAPWGGVRKVIKRSVVTDNSIEYSNLRIGEEALFSLKSLFFSDTVGFLDEKPVYYYEVHQESQSTLKIDDPWGGTFEAVRDGLEKLGIYEKYADAVNAFNVSSTVLSLDRITQYYSGKERKQKLKHRMEVYKNRKDARYGINKMALSYKSRVFIFALERGCYLPVFVASKMRELLK